jgi:hypothetical protein
MLERNLYNYGYYYRNYRNNYGPTFYPAYNNQAYNQYNNYLQIPENNIKNENLNESDKIENDNKINEGDNENSKEDILFRLGPIVVSNNKMSLFNYSFALDDLIIFAIVLFLVMEDSCDYALLIALGLLLLDSNKFLGNLGFLKNLNLFS